MPQFPGAIRRSRAETWPGPSVCKRPPTCASSSSSARWRPIRIASRGCPQTRIFYAENIWPERPAGFRPVFGDYYPAMEDLAARLMRIFAVALDLPERYFDDKIDHHFNTCPTNHYPVVDDPETGQLRAGEHTDFGSLTILAFNDAPRRPAGPDAPTDTWFDVKAQSGELVVNIGDMMARWTNDRWKSTVHRVVEPAAGRPGVAGASPSATSCTRTSTQGSNAFRHSGTPAIRRNTRRSWLASTCAKSCCAGWELRHERGDSDPIRHARRAHRGART